MSILLRKFSIPTYNSLTTYFQYDVVKVTLSGKENYFVCKKETSLGELDDITYLTNSAWARFDDINLDFASVWTPTITSKSSFDTRVATSSFNDGATKYEPDGINFSQFKFDLSFQNITDREAKSLLCFFYFLEGCRQFAWTVPEPYGQKLFFVCDQGVKHTRPKYNTNNINAGITQSYQIYSNQVGQSNAGILAP